MHPAATPTAAYPYTSVSGSAGTCKTTCAKAISFTGLGWLFSRSFVEPGFGWLSPLVLVLYWVCSLFVCFCSFVFVLGLIYFPSFCASRSALLVRSLLGSGRGSLFLPCCSWRSISWPSPPSSSLSSSSPASSCHQVPCDQVPGDQVPGDNEPGEVALSLPPPVSLAWACPVWPV